MIKPALMCLRQLHLKTAVADTDIMITEKSGHNTHYKCPSVTTSFLEEYMFRNCLCLLAVVFVNFFVDFFICNEALLYRKQPTEHKLHANINTCL